MSFIIAGCVLMLALIASIMLDGLGGIRRQHARPNVQPFDVW